MQVKLEKEQLVITLPVNDRLGKTAIEKFKVPISIASAKKNEKIVRRKK